MEGKIEISVKAAQILVELLRQCSFTVDSQENQFADAKQVYEEVRRALEALA